MSGQRDQVEIIDLNCVKQRLRKKGRIADCGILWNRENWVAVIELKGGQKDQPIRNLVEQIQEGLFVLAELLNGQSTGDVLAILMYKGPNPTAALDRHRVEFRGQRQRIYPYKCGTTLAHIVREVIEPRRRPRRR